MVIDIIVIITTAITKLFGMLNILYTLYPILTADLENWY